MPDLSLQARLAKHLLRMIMRRSARLSIEQRRAWPDLTGQLRQKRHPDLVILPATIGGVDCEWVFRRTVPAAASALAGTMAGDPAETTADPGTVAQAIAGNPDETTADLGTADPATAGDPAETADVAPTEPEGPTDAVIIYFHGGGYVTGSLLSARVLSTSLAIDMPVRLLSVNYRLAPEHPFPAALEDAIAVFEGLLADGWRADRIGMIGDSAGGGLALAATMALRDRRRPLPACLALISPWTDLTGRSPSFHDKAEADVILAPEAVLQYARYYVGENAPNHPYISPVYGRFEGLPPMLVHAGSDELLLDDARRIVSAAGEVGVEATLKVWPGLFHIFSLAADLVPEARASMDEIMAFLCDQLICRDQAVGAASVNEGSKDPEVDVKDAATADETAVR